MELVFTCVDVGVLVGWSDGGVTNCVGCRSADTWDYVCLYKLVAPDVE
jgi:hypothetical protein